MKKLLYTLLIPTSILAASSDVPENTAGAAHRPVHSVTSSEVIESELAFSAIIKRHKLEKYLVEEVLELTRPKRSKSACACLRTFNKAGKVSAVLEKDLEDGPRTFAARYYYNAEENYHLQQKVQGLLKENKRLNTRLRNVINAASGISTPADTTTTASSIYAGASASASTDHSSS